MYKWSVAKLHRRYNRVECPPHARLARWSHPHYHFNTHEFLARVEWVRLCTTLHPNYNWTRSLVFLRTAGGCLRAPSTHTMTYHQELCLSPCRAAWRAGAWTCAPCCGSFHPSQFSLMGDRYLNVSPHHVFSLIYIVGNGDRATRPTIHSILNGPTSIMNLRLKCWLACSWHETTPPHFAWIR